MSEKQVTHTQGPWEVYSCEEGERHGQVFAPDGVSDGKTVCDLPKSKLIQPKDKRKNHYFVHSAEDEANARLIAAAPEMYEVLKEIFRLSEIGLSNGILYGKKLVTEMGTENIPTHEKVRAILAKVEGETV